MRAKLSRERRLELVRDIRRHFEEHLDEEIGDLKAGLLLDFFLETAGPSIYNQAIRDVQAHLRTKLDDLDGELDIPEPRDRPITP